MEYGTHYLCPSYDDLALFVKECKNAGVKVDDDLLEWSIDGPQSWPITPYWGGGSISGSRAHYTKPDGPLRLSRSDFMRRLINEFGNEQSKRLSLFSQQYTTGPIQGHIHAIDPSELRSIDDEIRVGDTVTIPYCPEFEYIVTQMEPTMSVCVMKSPLGNEGTVYTDQTPSVYVKKKAATPVSGNNNNQHEVLGSIEGVGVGRGEGEAVRAGRVAGIIAVGIEPAGNPISARIGKGRLGVAKVLHKPVSSGHL